MGWTGIERTRRAAWTVALALTIGGATVAATPGVAHAKGVVDCDVYAYYPNVLISSARNISCSAAARDMRRNRKPISTRFTTPGGFRCVRVSGGSPGGQWRCTKGAAAYRFDFGD